MGSSTSKIASSRATPHLFAGPIVLAITFIINMLINTIRGIDFLKINGGTIIIGALLFFFINWYIATNITIPAAVKEDCNKVVPFSERMWHGLWPAFMSAIGDPNVVTTITFITPLVILAPIITTLLPIGPLTLGITMLLQKALINVPVIGTILSIFPINRVFELITSSWFFIAALFLIGYNFWSWLGGMIAVTRAMNQTC